MHLKCLDAPHGSELSSVINEFYALPEERKIRVLLLGQEVAPKKTETNLYYIIQGFKILAI